MYSVPIWKIIYLVKKIPLWFNHGAINKANQPNSTCKERWVIYILEMSFFLMTIFFHIHFDFLPFSSLSSKIRKMWSSKKKNSIPVLISYIWYLLNAMSPRSCFLESYVPSYYPFYMFIAKYVLGNLISEANLRKQLFSF